jgi:cytochrome c-type biogenesis protein CcmH
MNKSKAMYTSRQLQITNYGLPLAILIAFVLTLVSQTAALAQGPTPTDDEVNRIAKEMYCPVCENTPLDVCPTEACRQWRDLIRSMLAEGRSEEEIKQYFVAQYGIRVLAEPPNRLTTYLIPTIAILLGAFLLFRGFQMWMRPSITGANAAESELEAKPVQDPYIARLEEELKKQK